MPSTSHLLQRGLLLAGAVALPLLAGAAVAQTAPSGGAAPAAVAADNKELGALKATPAEKKAAHDKLSTAGQTTPKAAIAKRVHVVRPSPSIAKSGGAADAAMPAAPPAQ